MIKGIEQELSSKVVRCVTYFQGQAIFDACLYLMCRDDRLGG